MLGSHLSIAGGLHNAADEAQRLGMDCVQIFTKNQRQWRSAPLTDADIEQWKQHFRRARLKDAVSHDSYLINLASGDRSTREKSVALFVDEIERCEALAIPWLVTHPGAHLGAGEATGLKRVARALDRAHRRTSGYKTVTCLEITAGQGSGLGWRFEHLRRIIDMVAEPQRLAVCFDTAHALAAGYNLTRRAGMQATLDEFDDVIGLDLLKVFHLNDSKTKRRSRVDRHEHIGRGHVARIAFAVIVRDPRFRRIPKILETPKAAAPNGQLWDAVNLQTLRKLQRSR